MLKDYTDYELQAELKRRADDKKQPQPPKPLNDIDWGTLESIITQEIAYVAKERCSSKDFEHYVFETALETVYGPDIWDWYNEALDG